MTLNNPLLQPFEEAPFSKIKTEHYQPAIKEAIALAKAEIDSITASAEAPTFKNTIETLR